MLTVYLDSSVYSHFSDPRRRQATVDADRAKLLAWAKSGDVQFVYSGVLLSEMAPLDPDYAPAATARTDLLVALCGRNALIAFNRILELELRAIDGRAVGRDDVFSSNGDWYPPVRDIVSPVQWVNSLEETGHDMGLNRAQRRAVRRKLLKGGKPRSGVRESLSDGLQLSDFREVMSRYPMRRGDAEVIARYVMGDATKEEAEAAFLESLRDPRWMMRWFRENHDKMSTIVSWLRNPAEKLHRVFEDLFRRTQDLREQLRSRGIGLPEGSFSSSWKKKTGDDWLVGNVMRLRETLGLRPIAPPSAAELRRSCPGFATCLGAITSTAWDMLTETPREPAKSDIADAMHAIYAPYVDVFVADRYMAPHIQRQVAPHGTAVVGLPDLVGEIGRRCSGTL